MIPNPTADTPPQSPPHTPNIHNNTKTAMQVISHTLRQHLTTRQTQPPTTHTIPKLALDYRNHRLHLPTLTIQPARFDTLHDPRTQHARPRPQPPSTPNRRYHIRPLYIATIKPCVRQQPKPRRTPPAWARNGANHGASEPGPRPTRIPTINWLAVPTTNPPVCHESGNRHSPCRCESLWCPQRRSFRSLGGAAAARR